MHDGPARRPGLSTVSLAAAGAAAVSLAVVAVPWLHNSFEAPSLRVALETVGALLAVATVVALFRQCGRSSRADHIWLLAGLGVLAVTALAVAALIVAGAWSPREARYAMGGNLAGTLLLAVAAHAPARAPRIRRRTLWLLALALGAAVAALAALLAGAGSAGPPPPPPPPPLPP